MNQATEYASQHKLVPVRSQDKLGGLRSRKGIRRNMGVGAPLVSVEVASTGTVGASDSIIFPGSTKIQKIFFWYRPNRVVLDKSR